ncbi:MAG: PQQ-binding-like beta-propeller repeat protein, partial [Pirellulaceae bacterium]
GRIVLIGKNKVKAVNLADSKVSWPAAIDLGDDTPAGRGFYTGKYYYLPLSNRQLAKIDLEQGTIVSRDKTEIDLGNVVCYEDQLVSQSAQQVAAFYLTEPLLAWIEETLKANPDDPQALALKGQVLLQGGKREEALALLRRAVENGPQDLAAKSLLVKVMLSLLRDDFAANFHLAEELDQLVTDPAQRREILRWRAQGMAKAGKTWEAFAALVELADSWDSGSLAAGSGQDALESAEPDLSVRPDRWLQGQLASLWRTADEPTRQQMAEPIQARLDRSLAADSTPALREFLSFYGFHALAHPARLALADKLIAAEQLLEAELLIGELLDSPDQLVAGPTCATLATAYEKARRFELAARFYGDLKEKFADVVCRDGLTGAQLAERAARDAALQPLLAIVWPGGQTDASLGEGGDDNSRRPGYQRVHSSISITEFGGAALPGLQASYDPNQFQQIIVRDDLGRTLTTASLRNQDNTFRRMATVPNYLPTGKTAGHLLVVGMGDQVVAVDALRPERPNTDGLLWRVEAMEIDPTNTRNLYAQQRTSSNPLAGQRTQTYDPSGRLNFYTGPVQASGICFQKGRQLVCVDPLTGQPIWERGRIPASAEIFGDEELLFVADPNSDEALVLSALDGASLGRRKVERADRRWATHGRRVLAWEQTGAMVKLRLYDAWEQGPDLWSGQFPLGSRGCLVDGEELAVLEPGGNFSVVSLADGLVQFASPLAPERALGFIHVLRSREQYLLIASQDNYESPPGMVINPINAMGGSHNRIHGRVYAFDRRTGKSQWQVPAFVAHHALPPDQPSESPLLFFVRNKTKVSGTGTSRAGSSGSVLCLDRRDGRIVWDSDAEPAIQQRITGQVNYCEIVADPLKKSVSLMLQTPPSAKTVTLQFTDQPAPPQPPAQTGELSSLNAGDLVGVVDRSINAAFDLLNKGFNPAGRLLPAILPAAPRVAPR